MMRQETLPKEVIVIGGGLAGCEAAFQLASRGIPTRLFEMRPKRMTEAHKSGDLAELVCSNSFGSDSEGTASWLLKKELEQLGGFILQQARKAQVPAGQSLAIDRVLFAKNVTESLASLSHLQLVKEEIKEIPPAGVVILATGPLTTPELTASLQKKVGDDSLYFYDAISPIVATESLDLNEMFYASRYEKGTPDFLNIPLTKGQYEEFVADLLTAEKVAAHDFEKEKYFEACMPIEVLAARGPKTLAFGPMKPVGLTDPKTGRYPYAVVQLRAENQYLTAYNLVGFQTKMKYGEQTRIFRKLPGLRNAEFLRLGSLHRNTYLNSPQVLCPSLQLRTEARVFIAGQLTGTEGYLESSATGLVAGLNAFRWVQNQPMLEWPSATMLGSLLASITDRNRKNFQPLNSNYGILPPLDLEKKQKMGKKEKGLLYYERSIGSLRGNCFGVSMV